MADDRLPALDGLRAIAVALVLVEHSWFVNGHPVIPWWSPGAFGVRLFFVLSGFLITGILLRAKERPDAHKGTIWTAFYLRRAVRIFPLAYLALLVAWLVNAPAMHDDRVWFQLAYLTNWTVLTHGFSGGLGHFWSLAVEEQFYLVWPALLLLLPRKALVPAMLLTIGGVIGMRVLRHDDPLALTVLLTSRADSFAIGGLLACVRWRQVWALVAGAAVLFLCSGVLPALTETGLVLLCAAVVIATIQHPLAILQTRQLRHLGTISYGIYVWHGLLAELSKYAESVTGVWLRFPTNAGFTRFAVLSLGAWLLAELSWRLLEAPCLRLKDHLPYGRREHPRQPARPELVGAH